MANRKFVSDQSVVGFFHESGTYANPTGLALQLPGLVQEHTPDEDMGVIDIRYTGAGDRNVGQFVDGPTNYTGTFSYFPQNWKLLHYALGSVSHTGSPSYVYTMSEIDSDVGAITTSGTANPFPSVTVYDAHVTSGGTNFVRQFKGANVDSMTISQTQGEPTNVEVSYVAQSVSFSSGTEASITAQTVRPFLWSDFVVHIPSGTAHDFTEFSLAINNNLEPPHYIDGTRNISAPIPTNRDYELSLTLHEDATNFKTFYDQYFIGGSTFNAMAYAPHNAGSLYIAIVMSGCKVTDMSAPTPKEGVIEDTLTVRPQSVVAIVRDDIYYLPW